MDNSTERDPLYMSPTPNEFDRVVILANPRSTRSGKSSENRPRVDHHLRARISDIVVENIAPRMEYIETTGVQSDDQDKLKSTLKKGDVLCIAGGDGTVNLAMNTLMDEDLSDLKVPVLPLWGGDVNDLARDLNGGPNEFRPSQILKNGSLVPIHPIRWDINGEVERAALYSDVGIFAKMADRFNGDIRGRFGYGSTPIRRLYQGQIIGGGIFRHKEGFTIEDEQGERSLYNLTVSSNKVMSKALRFPVSIQEQRIFKSEIDATKFASVQRWIGRAVVGATRGSYIGPSEHYDFKILSDAMVHFDAEPKALAADSEVRVSQEDRPFYGLSLAVLHQEY